MSAEKRFVQLVYIVLFLPVFIFMLTWIRPVIGVPVAITMAGALLLAIKSANGSYKLALSKKTIIITIGIAFVWCFLAGQGGFWYQSSDHAYRNAIFKDLIYHPWPVVFEKYDVLLNYYVGYWIVPALFGKIFLFMTRSREVAWLVARIALLLWSVLNITICFLLLSNVLKCKTTKRFFSAVLVFICFSGLDILGIYLLNKKAGLHLEWWCSGYQYSAFTVCLFWVYNQAVPAWIATLLLLSERRIENFAFCGLCILISSPIPLFGLFPLYLVTWLEELIKSKEKIVIIKKVVSIQNIIACLIIFPICLVYFSTNAAINMKDISQKGFSSAVEKTESALATNHIRQASHTSCLSAERIKSCIKLAVFFMVEAGIYILLLLKKQKKSLLFWCLILELLIIPFIHIGTSHDFCMRASIPPLIVLMTMTFEDFYDSYKKKTYKFTVYCVIFAFAILTPGKEIYRGVYEICKDRRFEDNRIISIEETISPDYGWNNFISYDYSESFFYKYLSKK